jgi:hypothetical protein
MKVVCIKDWNNGLLFYKKGEIYEAVYIGKDDSYWIEYKNEIGIGFWVVDKEKYRFHNYFETIVDNRKRKLNGI